MGLKASPRTTPRKEVGGGWTLLPRDRADPFDFSGGCKPELLKMGLEPLPTVNPVWQTYDIHTLKVILQSRTASHDLS